MTSDDMKATAKDTAERAGQAANDTKSSVKGVAGKIGDAARDLADRASDTASDLYDRAQNRIPDQASDAVAAGQRAYAHSSKTVAKQVSKQPIEALLLAGAIGYLVGWATSRS